MNLKRKTRKMKKGGSVVMKIMYPTFTLKNINTVSTVEDTQHTPQIILPNIELSTLMMHDPDSSQPSWLHWLVVNIPNGDISKGNTIVSYNGPSPPPNTGTHHYIFELYSQNLSILPRNIKRNSFVVKHFVEDYNLNFLKKQMFKVNT